MWRVQRTTSTLVISGIRANSITVSWMQKFVRHETVVWWHRNLPLLPETIIQKVGEGHVEEETDDISTTTLIAITNFEVLKIPQKITGTAILKLFVPGQIRGHKFTF